MTGYTAKVGLRKPNRPENVHSSAYDPDRDYAEYVQTRYNLANYRGVAYDQGGMLPGPSVVTNTTVQPTVDLLDELEDPHDYCGPECCG